MCLCTLCMKLKQLSILYHVLPTCELLKVFECRLQSLPQGWYKLVGHLVSLNLYGITCDQQDSRRTSTLNERFLVSTTFFLNNPFFWEMTLRHCVNKYRPFVFIRPQSAGSNRIRRPLDCRTLTMKIFPAVENCGSIYCKIYRNML